MKTTTMQHNIYYQDVEKFPLDERGNKESNDKPNNNKKRELSKEENSYSGMHHSIDSRIAEKFGIKKASIICNLALPLENGVPYEDLYLNFPYFSEEEFYSLLEELVEEGFTHPQLRAQ